MNLVMIVIRFAVSILFIVFICTHLICARIQLRTAHRCFQTSSRSNLSIIRRGLHCLEAPVLENFPAKKYSDEYFSSLENAHCQQVEDCQLCDVPAPSSRLLLISHLTRVVLILSLANQLGQLADTRTILVWWRVKIASFFLMLLFVYMWGSICFQVAARIISTTLSFLHKDPKVQALMVASPSGTRLLTLSYSLTGNGKMRLRAEMEAGRVFQGMREGIISFPPTYKFERHQPGLSGYDVGEKKRVHAWCDRILYQDNRLSTSSECSLDCPVVGSILE